jgi:hypothetical protein
MSQHRGDEPRIQGWSKQGAEFIGKTRPREGACYYCGVPGCTECGDPPRILTDSADVFYGDLYGDPEE